MKNELLKRKKIIIPALVTITALFLSFSLLCVVTMWMYSPVFLSRVLTHFDSQISDYQIFPERKILKSDSPYIYVKNFNKSIENIPITYEKKEVSLKQFISKTSTTSFIIIQNDELIYEQYENGYDVNSTNTSFSMAKSVVSLLIGKAIEKGYIEHISDPISQYITEFKDKEIGKTTIEELLLMRSKICYSENKLFWFGDDTLTYFHPNLRKLALHHTKLTNQYQQQFHYNNYHPLLLGIILERCTNMSVSQFFQQEIWQKIGSENDASWSLDSLDAGFEKMESGLNFKAIDFIKIGSMVLHHGYWNNMQIMDKNYLSQATVCTFPLKNKDYENSFLKGKNIGYQYMWYCTENYDMIAWGKSDQILYICPEKQVVILRCGKTDGGIANWPIVLQNIISYL